MLEALSSDTVFSAKPVIMTIFKAGLICKALEAILKMARNITCDGAGKTHKAGEAKIIFNSAWRFSTLITWMARSSASPSSFGSSTFSP